jgi:hypothetical protein
MILPASSDLAGPDPGPGFAIIRADEADAQTLSQVIAEAFGDLPPSRWLIPDPAARRDILPGYFRLHVEDAMTGGVVHTTPRRDAAALWLPAGPAAPPPPADYAARLAAATRPWTDRFRVFDAALEQHHPADFRHRHPRHPRRGSRGPGAGHRHRAPARLPPPPRPPLHPRLPRSRRPANPPPVSPAWLRRPRDAHRATRWPCHVPDGATAPATRAVQVPAPAARAAVVTSPAAQGRLTGSPGGSMAAAARTPDRGGPAGPRPGRPGPAPAVSLLSPPRAAPPGQDAAPGLSPAPARRAGRSFVPADPEALIRAYVDQGLSLVQCGAAGSRAQLVPPTARRLAPGPGTPRPPQRGDGQAQCHGQVLGAGHAIAEPGERIVEVSGIWDQSGRQVPGPARRPAAAPAAAPGPPRGGSPGQRGPAPAVSTPPLAPGT